MNDATRIGRKHALRVAAALWIGLSAGTVAGCSRPPPEPPLQGARIGGPFTLVDQSGRTVRDSDFGGRYRLIYFGYTFCPDICPTDLQTIGRAVSAFEKEDPARARRLQPIFITVDPQRDTPAVLKAYVAAFHPRLIGLTGTAEQIAAVKKGFGIYSSRQAAGSANNYLVDHSRMAVLLGPKGEPIALVPETDGVKAVTAVLQQWVK